MNTCERCKTPGQRVLVKGLCPACAGSELAMLRKHDTERKAIIDDALCSKIESLEKEKEAMAQCHCMQCTDMQCEGPSRVKAKET